MTTMLSRLPIAIAEELNCGAVDEQVKGAIDAAIRDLDDQYRLPSAQRPLIRHKAIQVRYLQQSGCYAGRLPERRIDQDLDGSTELDRRVREPR
jgi:hypothetical protein